MVCTGGGSTACAAVYYSCVTRWVPISSGETMSMIIDGHAYCFPPIAGANGFPSAAHHLRYLQREMADHHQPNWRLSDWQVGDNAMLADAHDPTVEGNKDVNFRPGSHGRFTWTVDGEEYAKQYLPPYLVDMSHSPELLIAQMDYVGVQYAVLHVHPIFGYLNDYVADCVQRYPDRLLGLAAVPDQMVEGDPTAAVAEVVRAYDRGLRGLQFVVKSRYRFGLTQSWDGLVCRPFWDAVVALGKPIFFTIEPCPGSSLDDYLDQLYRCGQGGSAAIHKPQLFSPMGSLGDYFLATMV